MTDALSRYVEIFTAPSEDTFVALKGLITCILTRHGIPSLLLLDQATCFTSNEFQQFCSHFHVARAYTSAGSHHPTAV